MKKTILFLCTGNSCRSQMAEGFMRHYFGKHFDVYSAGTNPSHLNVNAVKVMKEADINISNQKSKSVELYLKEHFDYLITVCDDANESCPVFSGKVKQRLHWGFEDPAEARGTEKEIIEKFCKIRNLIKDKILEYFQNN